jgi:hypothetical protein
MLPFAVRLLSLPFGQPLAAQFLPCKKESRARFASDIA